MSTLPADETVDSAADAIGLGFVLVTDLAQARDGALASGLITREDAAAFTDRLEAALNSLGIARIAVSTGDHFRAGRELQAAQMLLEALRNTLIARGVPLEPPR